VGYPELLLTLPVLARTHPHKKHSKAKTFSQTRTAATLTTVS
jgi:hypothetical protein